MFCSKCGEPVIPDANFCAKCGVSLVPSVLPPAPSKTMLVKEISSAPRQVRPWVRWWARMFDLYIFSLVGGTILGLVAPSALRLVAEDNNQFLAGMIMIFAWVFVESLLLSSFHTTPGKWIFRTKISMASGESITYASAFNRSLEVWWRGLGMGFPVVPLITSIVAYRQLKRNGVTPWDKEGGFVIAHEPIGVPRILFTGFVIFVMVLAVGRSVHA